VVNYPQPKNVKEVRSFCGLCNYFRKTIPNYADKIHGLTRLLRKDAVFTWGSEQEQSFQTMKTALTNPPVMALPHHTATYYFTCDTSDIAVSFNLSQIIGGTERVIEFAARGLRAAELSYTVSEKEVLAVVCGVQHYHEHLNGKSFVVSTDHHSLKYLCTVKNNIGRLGRWNLLLSSYDYQVEFVRGKQNSASDALSRIPLPAPDEGPEKELDNMLLTIDEYIIQSKADMQRQQHKRRLYEITVVHDTKSCHLPTASLNTVTDDDTTTEHHDIVNNLTSVQHSNNAQIVLI